MRIDLNRAAQLLCDNDNILILSHQNPDGDTLGSALALTFALRNLKKTVSVYCTDGFPENFKFMYNGEKPCIPDTSEPYIVAVDVASPVLLGDKMSDYYDKINLCIDHHSSNTDYAEYTLLESDSAATAEIILKLIDFLGAGIDKQIATCLYTGISTDTGCFRYSNTTAQSHRFAARLIECGIDFSEINRQMFEVKSVSRIAVEQYVLNSVRYFHNKKCALIYITKDILHKTGSNENELESLSSVPYQIKGVKIGITLRERENGYKISVRTAKSINAAEICAQFGGGGHLRAAGCFINGGLEEVIQKISEAADKALSENEKLKKQKSL